MVQIRNKIRKMNTAPQVDFNKEVESKVGEALSAIKLPENILEILASTPDIGLSLLDSLEHHNTNSLACSDEMYYALATKEITDMNMHELVNALNAIYSSTPHSLGIDSANWIEVKMSVSKVMALVDAITMPILTKVIDEVRAKHQPSKIVPASKIPDNKKISLSKK